MNQEQWMEERRKEIESVLDLYSKGFGLQEDDCDVIDFPEATNRLLTLLQSQIEAAYQRGRNDGAEAEAVRDSIHHQP